jgi:toxin ParE1/3/4
MARIVYSPRARADLNEIWDYIAADNIAAADRVAARFDSIFDLLAQRPRMGRLRDEIAEGVRTFPAGNYLLLYRPTNDGIDVLRVIHGARDLGSIAVE